MAVDTKKVQCRRELRFYSLDEMLADAQKLVASPQTEALGNWPLAQLLSHLTTTIDSSIDGIPARAPWLFRLFGRAIKGRILKKGMSAGFRLPKGTEAAFYPPVASPQEALDRLRTAVGRLKSERMTARHPVFGQLTHEEWTQLHLRHAELHLSFATPA